MENQFICCRSCGLESPKRSSSLNDLHQDRFLQDIFYECTNIDTKSDILPKILCNKCMALLKSFYNFRLMSPKTNTELLQTYLQIKHEVPDDIEVEMPLRPMIVETDFLEIKETPLEMQSSPEWSDQQNSPLPTNQIENDKPKMSYFHRCQGCREIFNTKDELRKHRFLKKGCKNHMWCCDFCDKTFDAKHYLYSHIIRIHKERRCKNCLDTFTGMQAYRLHAREVHKVLEKSEMCSQCNKSFGNKRLLTIHVRAVHEKETNFFCHICGKRTFHKANLQNHLKTHSNERPYQCSIPGCEKRFKLRGQVLQHELTHGTEKNYTCEICQLKVKSKYYLKEHMKIHDFSGSFKCELCNQTFARPNYLRDHRKLRHSLQAGVTCKECGKMYANEKSLRQHMHHHRDAQFECSYCEKRFVKNDILRKHVNDLHEQNRAMPCKECNEIFYKRSDYRRHLKHVHNKKNC